VRWFWQYEMRVWLCFLAHFKLLHVEQRCDDNEGILRKLLLNFKAIAQQPVRELGSEPLRTPIVSNATAFVVSTWWTTPEALCVARPRFRPSTAGREYSCRYPRAD
jgi:hypothetical protein